MWTNSLLKHNGWNMLKPHYWTAFGVIVVYSIITAATAYGSSFLAGMFSLILGMSETEKYIFMYSLSSIAGLLLAIFLVNLLEVGMNRYFCRARTGDVDLGNLFWGFYGNHYKFVMNAMFHRYIQIVLWSLLFFIPGIIKTYEYILVPYLLAENPHLGKRALDISKQTMQGEKVKCFWLQLSFIGWSLAGLLFGIGIYFVIPYYQATMAEFYYCMRAKMFAMQITSPEELQNPETISETYEYTEQNVNPYHQTENFQQNTYIHVDSVNSTPEQPEQKENPYYSDSDKIDLTKHDDNHNSSL